MIAGFWAFVVDYTDKEGAHLASQSLIVVCPSKYVGFSWPGLLVAARVNIDAKLTNNRCVCGRQTDLCVMHTDLCPRRNKKTVAFSFI